MKLAKIDNNGINEGFYDSEIHLKIPDGCIEITEEKWMDLLNNPNQRWSGKKWVKYDLESTITDEQRWEKFNNIRSGMLSDSDWTQMPDSPLSMEKKAEWATWRQLVRDIPNSFPIPKIALEELNKLKDEKPTK